MAYYAKGGIPLRFARRSRGGGHAAGGRDDPASRSPQVPRRVARHAEDWAARIRAAAAGEAAAAPDPGGRGGGGGGGGRGGGGEKAADDAAAAKAAEAAAAEAADDAAAKAAEEAAAAAKAAGRRRRKSGREAAAAKAAEEAAKAAAAAPPHARRAGAAPAAGGAGVLPAASVAQLASVAARLGKLRRRRRRPAALPADARRLRPRCAGVLQLERLAGRLEAVAGGGGAPNPAVGAYSDALLETIVTSRRSPRRERRSVASGRELAEPLQLTYHAVPLRPLPSAPARPAASFAPTRRTARAPPELATLHTAVNVAPR